jgi:hypothetical protein
MSLIDRDVVNHPSLASLRDSRGRLSPHFSRQLRNFTDN